MKRILYISSIIVLMSSCKMTSIGTSKVNIDFQMGRPDMEVSAQKTAEGKVTKLFGFWTLSKKTYGMVTNNGFAEMPTPVPFIGASVSGKSQFIAMYNLKKSNPGYDFILYPSFEYTYRKILFGIVRKENATITARLGRLKED
ncbi:MAG: hypothetical protein MRY83_14530 [Flavobacteriales bacterium]|nr:hypothetical protein [Flavobacteriales bacterium]